MSSFLHFKASAFPCGSQLTGTGGILGVSSSIDGSVIGFSGGVPAFLRFGVEELAPADDSPGSSKCISTSSWMSVSSPCISSSGGSNTSTSVAEAFGSAFTTGGRSTDSTGSPE